MLILAVDPGSIYAPIEHAHKVFIMGSHGKQLSTWRPRQPKAGNDPVCLRCYCFLVYRPYGLWVVGHCVLLGCLDIMASGSSGTTYVVMATMASSLVRMDWLH
jgi:hypothetical protein